FTTGQKTVVIEDLISTGKSSLQVVDVLRQNGLNISGMVSIFNYQFEQAEIAFKTAGVDYFSLTNYPSLLNLAGQKGIIQPKDEEVLLKWRSDPANWTGLS
ncbi:MAG: orotate phosphoribosyltransferase, partial [Flavisolibacter sp.]